MKDTNLAVILMVFCTFFTSAGQILYKLGSERLSFQLLSIITNWPILLGLISYFIALIFMMLAYSKGELTILYPVLATSYIWVVLFASMIFPEEQIKLINITGVLAIVLGIGFIGVGSK